MKLRYGLILSFVFCFSLASFGQVESGIRLAKPGAHSPENVCLDFAGTSNQTLTAASQTNNIGFLAWNDGITITHNGDNSGNGNNTGDPIIGTTPGIDYAVFTCAPSLSGNTFAIISTDPCIVLGGGVNTIVTNGGGTSNGNSSITNAGGYQTLLNAGNPVQVWFAPVTMDDFNPAGSFFEDVGGADECLHINVAAAFNTVFLNQIVASNQVITGLTGNFDLIGGLPQWDNTAFTITAELSTNAAITGTVTNGPITHGDNVNLTVPQGGTYNVTVTDGIGASISFTLDFCDPNFTATLDTVSPILCNMGTTGLVLSANGGLAPYTYTWEMAGGVPSGSGNIAGANGSSIIPGLSAGLYSATITDDNACTAVTQYNLTQPTFAGANTPIVNQISCNGAADGVVAVVAQGGTPPYTYLWSNASTSDTLFNLGPSSNQITVTDANGCTFFAGTTLFEPNPIDFTINHTDASCSGSLDGSAFVTNLSGGTLPYTFTWDGGTPTGPNGDTATALDVGWYRVTVSDANMCQSIDSVLIGATVIILPNATIDSVNCFNGTDGSVTLNPSGSPNLPYAYTWSANAITGNAPIAALLTAGSYDVTIFDNTGVCNVQETYTVFEPTALTITVVDSGNVTCNGADDGFIQVSASGGTALVNYNYDWGGGTVGATINNLPAGVYTVTVTDDNSCSNTAQITLTEPGPITIDGFDTTGVSCFNGFDGSITVNASGGVIATDYSYLWTGGINTQTISNIPAGTYFVTVTDDNNCSTIDSFTLGQPPLFTVVVDGDDPSCFGQTDGSVFATISGGTGPTFTYAWNVAGTNDTLINLPAGSYTVTVTDANNCTATNTDILIEPAAINTFFFDIDSVSCFNSTDGSATPTVTGGTPGFTFLWENGETDSIAIGLGQGWQSVTITDSEGCPSADSVFILGPDPIFPDFVITDALCFGESSGTITVLPSGGTLPYSYDFGPGFQPSNSLNGLPTGSYPVTIQDGNGCTLGPIEVFVGQADSIQLDIIPTDAFCNGESSGTATAIPLGGTLPYAYAWSDPNNQNDPVAIGLAAGDYTLTLTDANGCSATDTTTIGEPDPLTAVIDSIVPPTCFGYNNGQIYIDPVNGGTGPYTFSLDGQLYQPLNIFPFVFAGSYTLYVQDINGCEFETDFVMDQPDPITVALGPDVEIQMGDSVMLNALFDPPTLDSFLWAPTTALSCTDCPDPVAMPLSTITYTLQVVDNEGCFGEDEILIDVDRNRNIYVPNAFTPNGDGDNDRFMIFGGVGVQEVSTFQVYDRWGELLFFRENFQPNDPSFGWDGRFRGKEVNTGVYIFYAEVTYIDGEVIPVKGSITLLK